jgi:thioesterase domain-containing protein
MRATGSGFTLFATPAGTGDYSYVGALAEQLEALNPVYAVPWPTLHLNVTMPEIAAMAVATIRRVQSRGPYHLIGYSSGGVLTYAIAHHLTLLGEEVSFLGLIDTVMVEPVDVRLLGPLDPKQMLIDALAAQAPETIDCRVEGRARQRSSLNDLLEEAVTLGLTSDTHEQGWIQLCNYGRALTTYVPPRLNIPINQFNASITASDVDQVKDLGDFLGWEKFVSPTWIERHIIPGTHKSIMADQNKRAYLAQQMSSSLCKLLGG